MTQEENDSILFKHATKIIKHDSSFVKMLKFMMTSEAYLLALMISCFVMPFENMSILDSPNPMFSIMFRCILPIIIFSMTHWLNLGRFEPFFTFPLAIGIIFFLPKQIMGFFYS